MAGNRPVAEVVATAVAAHRDEPGPLLVVLQAVVAELGHVPDAAIRPIAEALNLSRAEVHGVISFYHDLRIEPPGRVVAQVCRAEACQSVGANAVLDGAAERLAVKVGTTAEDGALTLDEVFCLGNCALGPSALIDGRLHGRLTADRLSALIQQRLQQTAAHEAGATA
ncbi:MAG: NAD(P)H-dependent oxidoreductase subunit E [Kineosporiaceae bacterium]|nr:NAD(P)H-dependent oxidoreductase subunit E [Kineosporiaceae bacterium]MBK8077546.1 NAD(P)H-dependent oxidoreductase subunit E [Kineosporiaceae bacterium]